MSQTTLRTHLSPKLVSWSHPNFRCIDNSIISLPFFFTTFFPLHYNVISFSWNDSDDFISKQSFSFSSKEFTLISSTLLFVRTAGKPSQEKYQKRVFCWWNNRRKLSLLKFISICMIPHAWRKLNRLDHPSNWPVGKALNGCIELSAVSDPMTQIPEHMPLYLMIRWTSPIFLCQLLRLVGEAKTNNGA